MTIAGNVGPFGDTTLTKVFVGGLAWETPKDVMKEHFDKYGHILEAVIICDKVTGRSKGYGFVTFKEAEAAKRACEDATPIISGRRANCNLASLGARRIRSANSTPPRQAPTAVGPRSTSTAAPTTNHVQTWYYPAGSPASALYHQQNHHPVPYYGYAPTYMASDINYNHAKVNYTSGGYVNMNMNMNGHYSHQMYPGQAYVGGGGNTLVPMYPLYHFHNQSQTMGLPAHVFPPATAAAGHIATVPTIISKPPPIVVAPNTGTICSQ